MKLLYVLTSVSSIDSETTLPNSQTDWALILNIMQFIVGIVQCITLIVLVAQLIIERKNSIDQRKVDDLSNTYKVMETRLLEILRLRYQINVRLNKDIYTYFAKNGKDKLYSEKKEIMIDLYLKTAKYSDRKENIIMLLNSYEYLCSAIENKFINEEIIKKQHKAKLIETYEEYYKFIEQNKMASYTRIYTKWKKN